MRRLLSCLILATLLVAASPARSTFHFINISEIYSNADGTVQYVVLAPFADGQNLLAGHTLLTSGTGSPKIFAFPNNLPSSATFGKHILIATQGFADLHLVIPDYIIPNGFVPTTNGTVNYGEGVSQWSYASLPTDGVTALFANSMTGPNVATNFAGASGSVAPTAPAPNYQGLWWKTDEAGWGVNFAHDGNVIYATWYTYDTAGNAYWLSMLAPSTTAGGNTYHGDIVAYSGPPFNNFAGATNSAKVGDGTITFSDANTGTFAYNLVLGTGGATTAISQVKPITRYVLDPGSAQPVCTLQATPDLNAATNYQDLWWLPTETGWGVNFAHQGNLIYATWYTYDAKGAPLWLSALLTRTPGTNSFGGSMQRYAGPRFDSFKATDLGKTDVGSVTLTFSGGNQATFQYVTTGSGGLAAVDQTKSIVRLILAPPAATVCH